MNELPAVDRPMLFTSWREAVNFARQHCPANVRPVLVESVKMYILCADLSVTSIPSLEWLKEAR